ncbi:class I SAM-dependent methyltransferase [Candidatus Omnitrophota bacterium]
MSWDSAWEKVFKEAEWGKYPSESLIRFIARNFYERKNRQDVRLLEVGCGPGGNLWYMAREGFDVYGVDASPTGIQRARRRLENEGLRADLKEADIINLPYADNYFDGVADVECIYCNSAENSKKILREIKRVMKKNALFYSKTFTDDMYVGSQRDEAGDLEYRNISDGPLAGKGFVRLTDNSGIKDLYGEFFKIRSVDKLEYSANSGAAAIKISEWIIICEKKD